MAARPNTALRLLRERTQSPATPGESLSRQELADLVNAHVLQSTERPGALDANYIGKLERGVITWPRAHYREALRSVLEVDADRELGLFRPVRTGRPAAVVEYPTITGTGLRIAPTSVPNGLLAAMSQLPVAVSREHVDAVRATAAMFTDADHSHGGGDVTSAAGVYLGHASELLRLPAPATLRPDLFSAVGWLGHVVGSAAFDATRHGEAGAAFAFALACAEQGGDWHLRAKVLSSMAREAIWRGDADTGLTWIELAMVRADRLTATERAMLLTARARALALLGRVEDTMRTVRAADEHFRRTNPGVDPPWMSYYDTAQHLGNTGHALFDLAVHGYHVKEATQRLAAAVAGHQPLYVRSKVMSGMKLATLTLRAGDPLEGAAIGHTALSDLDHLRSARTMQVVAALDQAAVPRMSHPTDAFAAPTDTTTPEQALHAACAQLGVDGDHAELIRLAENAIYRLPGRLVARVSRPGRLQTARREVAVSTWLQRRGFPVVRARTDLPQPVEIAGRAVTWWEELPPHTQAQPAQIGSLLRRLHAMPPDGITLPPTDPFVQIETRINSLAFLDPADRDWLLARAAELRKEYANRPPGSPTGLVHGDPWAGNVVATADGPVLLDLERFSLGPPEYDLVVIAASYTSYGTLPADDYRGLAAAYGRDVTTWNGYPLLRDIRELRVTTYAGQVALDHPKAFDQAIHRLRCLQGRHGPRPWSGWRAVP